MTTTPEELKRKIAEGLTKGSEVDQTHRENAEAFDPEAHAGMDASYLEHADKHLNPRAKPKK